MSNCSNKTIILNSLKELNLYLEGSILASKQFKLFINKKYYNDIKNVSKLKLESNKSLILTDLLPNDVICIRVDIKNDLVYTKFITN